MYKSERESEILRELELCGYATVDYLAQKIHISPSSIRRDLTDMECHGLVRRSYGGAQLVQTVAKNVPFSMRSHENASQKKAIARCAASLLHGGEVIFIDGSSTAFFLAEELTSIGGLTVVTNSVDITSMLSQYAIRTICTGGWVSPDNPAVLVEEPAARTIESIHADFAFFSSQSLTADGTVSDCYPAEVRLRRLMMLNATHKVLLIDSSKLETPSTFFQCRVTDLDTVISDRDLHGFFTKETGNTKLLCTEK